MLRADDAFSSVDEQRYDITSSGPRLWYEKRLRRELVELDCLLVAANKAAGTFLLCWVELKC